MKATGLIPARGGSKGVEKKNIKLLKGKPLIQYTIEAASKSKLLTDLVVSTDSNEIQEIANELGVSVPFLRPAELAGDRSPAVEYVKHYLEVAERGEVDIPEIIVILQPTSPFRSSEDIDSSIKLLMENRCSSVVSVSAIPKQFHPNWQFIIEENGKLQPYDIEDFSLLTSRRQDFSNTYTRNGAVYAFWVQNIERFGNIYGEDVLAYEMPKRRSVNIDDLADWYEAERVIEKETDV